MTGIPGMTISEKPYEILVRFDAEGAFQGAHIQNREVKIFQGHVLQEAFLPPVPLEEGALKSMVAALLKSPHGE